MGAKEGTSAFLSEKKGNAACVVAVKPNELTTTADAKTQWRKDIFMFAYTP
jgi:hypothetical protein